MGKRLSIILPTYNGSLLLQRNISGLRSYLNSLFIDYEIIIVDDGSRDREDTYNIAQENDCKFLANPRNLGKGAALRRGMLSATGDYRIYTDVDVPYEFITIEKFLWYLDFKEFHIVVGDRTLPESEYFSEIPWIRNQGSKLYSFIVGRFIVGGLFDTQCGIKGFRADVAEDIFSVSRINRFAVDVEVLYIALKRNYDIKRLPVKLRAWEPSQVRAVYDGITMLRDIFVILGNYHLGRYKEQGEIKLSIDTYLKNNH